MNLQKSRRLHMYRSVFDLLDSWACHLSIHLINRVGGHFHFPLVPLRLLIFLASLELSSSAAAVGLHLCFNFGHCIGLFGPDSAPAPPLFNSFSKFFFFSSIDPFRVRMGSWKFHGVLLMFFIIAYMIDSKPDISLCGSNDSSYLAIRLSLLCRKTWSGTSWTA